jgi:hypothetical protein
MNPRTVTASCRDMLHETGSSRHISGHDWCDFECCKNGISLVSRAKHLVLAELRLSRRSQDEPLQHLQNATEVSESGLSADVVAN